MSEIALAPAQLVDMRTGEMLEATPENAVELIVYARDMRSRLLNLVKDCEAVLLEASRIQGTKTLHLEHATATITGGSDLNWDLDQLARLLAVGLPDERYNELVVPTITYKVSAAIAKQLEAANPAYAEIIASARSRVEKPWRVTVK